ncbi:hypothetical protein KD146_11460 [Devosia sp. BSSL-BM10]|jgi:hypothetical protein|uniref:C-type lysozyme inhibitor domain-containing protein n=1 Tax=Devosia litorisediminis TaxID=2829817 RepID=A0A942E6U9_9HYPH|nr:hypothetical protein [Devosia litorisediminis]MBS3849313.1 hypothetical protein [Devosia litorisediminis]|tara:strand:- start:694 stop:1032 length:339 start_codon:yes stop_codon:yes gene_type:complete
MKWLVSLMLSFLALTAPALAQFPPPGIYVCIDGHGAAFGTLSLFVAGDYDIASEAIPRGQGQVTSSGSHVTAQSGPLADIGLTGHFVTDDYGDTVFDFETSMGALKCALPQG